MTDTAPSPTAPTPVMDVVAPPIEKKSDAGQPEADPVDKLAAADQKAQQAATARIDKHEKPAKQPAVAKHANQPHQAGVGAAITATVIIVLALAALATYAYVQTNK